MLTTLDDRAFPTTHLRYLDAIIHTVGVIDAGIRMLASEPHIHRTPSSWSQLHNSCHCLKSRPPNSLAIRSGLVWPGLPAWEPHRHRHPDVPRAAQNIAARTVYPHQQTLCKCRAAAPLQELELSDVAGYLASLHRKLEPSTNISRENVVPRCRKTMGI